MGIEMRSLIERFTQREWSHFVKDGKSRSTGWIFIGKTILSIKDQTLEHIQYSLEHLNKKEPIAKFKTKILK